MWREMGWSGGMMLALTACCAPFPFRPWLCSFPGAEMPSAAHVGLIPIVPRPPASSNHTESTVGADSAAPKPSTYGLMPPFVDILRPSPARFLARQPAPSPLTREQGPSGERSIGFAREAVKSSHGPV